MPDPIRKIALSRYAEQMLAAHPQLAREVESPKPFGRDEIDRALEGCEADDEAALKARLRRLRQRVMLRVMARDLDGAADLVEVCGTMSDLADASIACALGWADARAKAKHGTPARGRGELIVVGMGKLGGRELNVSSDIDLVFLYPEESDAADGLTNHEYFDEVGRRTIKLLADVTPEGFAFRVDMRLRPYGESGPLVASFEALEAYLVTQGREWERYAWIKARAITGGAWHAELDAIMRPFVYRKYLDFGALDGMRRLHAEVRRDVARRELAEHVKLGPGGIREIEFVVQALQLVRGGREPALAVRPTLDALERLAERGMLPKEAAKELAASYVFLRQVEHRLQYLDDAQTHLLPAKSEDRARVAAMAGFDTWEAFHARLNEVRAVVTRHFESVFAEGERDSEAWPAHARAELLRKSQRYATLSEDSRRKVDQLVPAFARAARSTPDPDATLTRAVDFVEAIAGRAAYLALLVEHPDALERVTKMIGASSWAAEFVTRHPLLLDELLDDRLLYAPPDLAAYETSLRRALEHGGADLEREMNLLREHHQAQVFRLLAQDLAGLLTVERLADYLSELADRTLGVALGLAWKQVRSRHRETPRFAVIAYGKLGGKELGYASDLDIIFLYDEKDEDERAQENYLRLAQRLNNLLSLRTSSGVLFETDLQLRPSGQKGLMVSSLEGFEHYQEQSAWVWEHQALTRARFCAGDTAIGVAFEALRVKILTRARDPAALAKEVLAMREKMHAAHPNRSGLFDVKHDRGGMIDVEFLVQFLILAHASKYPALTGNLGNIALLKISADLGLISSELAERCRIAYREFRRMQHALRLNGAQYARVPHVQSKQHASAVRELWATVFPPV